MARKKLQKAQVDEDAGSEDTAVVDAGRMDTLAHPSASSSSDSSENPGLWATMAAPNAKGLEEAGTTSRPLSSPSLRGAGDVDAEPVDGQLGRYEILSELGRGGMGVVHEALDPDLNRKVALKVLRGDGFSVEGRTRLIREAQMMARLSHPNVVTVYEVGAAGTQLYIAMEYVQGETLYDWLKRGPHQWHQILEMFGEAGRGLAAAHAEGVVHRDFKPANVLVGLDGRVRVTDFGIAHNKLGQGGMTEGLDEDNQPTPKPTPTPTPTRPAMLEDDASISMDMDLTATGSLLGTGPYVAPEIFWGEPATAASDQFAFCVAVWHALYGAFPFPGKTILDRMNSIMEASPVVPPGAPSVPKKLHKILVRGLSRNPPKRYKSMDDVIDELVKVCHGRRRRLMFAGGVAAIALIVGVTWFLTPSSNSTVAAVHCDTGADKLESVWGQGRQQEVKSAFEKSSNESALENFAIVQRELNDYAGEWATVHDAACSETQIEKIRPEEVMADRMQCLDHRQLELQALVNLLVSGEEDVVSGSAAAVYQLPSPDACRNAQPRSNEEPEELKGEIASVRTLLADATALEFMGRFAKGGEIAAKARVQAQQMKFLPIEAEALLTHGKLQWRAGDVLGARMSLIQAAAAAEEAHLPEIKSEAWIELVWVSGYELARVDEGLAWQQLAASSLRGHQSPSARLRARLLDNMGAGTSYQQERWEEAKGFTMQALELKKKEFGANHPAVAETYNRLAVIAFRMEDYEASKENLDAALGIFEKATGSNHAGVAFAHNNLGNIYGTLEDFANAKKHYDLAVAIGTRTTGRNHSEVAVALSNLGVLALREGYFDVAIKRMSEALEIEISRLGSAHPSTIQSHENLAVAYERAEDPENAIKHCQKGAELRASAQRGLTVAPPSELCEELLLF